MCKYRFRPAFETLERRDTPAFTSSLNGLDAFLIGDGAADNFRVTVTGLFLQHNRPASEGFASSTDWNTNVAGTQTLQARIGASLNFLDMGGGDDSLLLGSPTSSASRITAAVNLFTGGDGKDDVRIDDGDRTVGQLYDVTGIGVRGGGVNVSALGALENGLTLVCGTAADTVNVLFAANPLTIEGTGGLDTVRVGGGPGGMNEIAALVRVTNNGTLQDNTTLVLDDAADTGPNTVTIADSDNLGTIVTGLSSGAVEFDPGAVYAVSVEAGSGRDVFAYQATRVASLNVMGGAGDEQFIVNVPAGATGNVGLVGEEGADLFDVFGLVPAGLNLVVNGSDQSAGDRFSIGTTAGSTATVTHTSANAGSIQPVSGLGTVQFFNMRGVSLADPPGTLIVNLPPTANAGLALGDDGGANDPDAFANAGASLLTGPTVTATQFDNPTVSLVVNLGDGGDTITMAAMDAGYAPTLTPLAPGGTFLTGGAGADTFTITPDDDSPVIVIGDAPTTAPGDTLNVPSLVNTGGAVTPAGTLGVNPNFVQYSEIETLNLGNPPPPPPPPPTTFTDRQFAVGADRGGGTVRFFNPDQGERFATTPFGATFTGGVRVASADFTGDGIPDVVVGTGPGGPTRVRILNGVTQAEVFTIDPFEAAFTGGVYVAAGDITGDGVPELVITPDEGGGPRVRVFNGTGFGVLADFLGIDDRAFRGGARAAVGDLNGDTLGDLIVCAGFGGGPRIAAYSGAGLGNGGGTKLFSDFFLFEQALRNGAFVAVGDTNGDGFADLVGGGGPGGGPRVLILSGVDLTARKGDQAAVLANFFAGDVTSRGGIRVSTRHLDTDARADVVVGAGAGGGSRVTGYLGATLTAGGALPEAFGIEAFPGFTGGVFVG